MKTKNLLIYVILMLVSLMLTNCEDDVLEKQPEKQLSDATVWDNVDLIQLFINPLYDAWEVDAGMLYELIADEYCSPTNGTSWNISRDILLNTYDAGWNYDDIRRANKVIANVVDNETLTNEDKNFLLGQAYFFRGWYCFELAKKFGGIVLLDRPLDPEEDLDWPRSTLEETWEFIIKDFEKAVSLLEDGSKARASKGAALAMKIRAELYAGRYEDVKNTFAAIEKLDYDLHPTYGPIWKDPSLWKTSKEVIAGFEYVLKDKNNGWIRSTLTHSKTGDLNAGGAHGVTQDHVDVYLVIDEDGVERTWENSLHKANTNKEDGVLAHLYNNREVRFYENIVTTHTTLMGYDFYLNESGKNSSLTDFDAEMYDSHPSQVRTGYFIKKFIGDDAAYFPGGTKDCDLPNIVLRYAEVYLNYAEACIMTNDFDKARGVINKVRVRAGLSELTSNINIKEVYKTERRKELAFENHRYWDLLRWAKQEGQTIIPELNRKPKWMLINEELTDYKIREASEDKYDQAWSARRFLFPIPFGELEYNPNLKQNPGY